MGRHQSRYRSVTRSGPCALPPGSQNHIIVCCGEPRFKVSYSHRDVCRGQKNDRQIFKSKLVLAFCVAYWGKASSHPAAQRVISCPFSLGCAGRQRRGTGGPEGFFFFFVERFRFYGSKSGQSGATQREEVEDFGKVRLEPPYRLL